MAIHNLFFFLFLSIVHAQNSCPPSYCNNNSQAIRYPFWLQGRQLPSNCQPIGFNLSCNGQKKLILNIPYYGDFYVSSIYYHLRIVTLSDPDNCLPKKLLSSNLSYYPFMAVSYQIYTFISCPKGLRSSYVVDCLSNTTTDILALKYGASNFPKCKKNVTLALPVSSYFLDDRFPVEFDITWNDPDIGENKVTVSGKGHSSFKIAASVVVIVIICISCCICMMRRNNFPDSGSDQTSRTAGSSNTATAGLSTIETYKKITIGESRRVEGPNGVTCAICLADYVPKDTIMFLPECQHCFHADCIHQWLSIKAKCPICRTPQA
ncbi:hypothetical protein ABFS82_02G174100 [Erythranthe guttata]